VFTVVLTTSVEHFPLDSNHHQRHGGGARERTGKSADSENVFQVETGVLVLTVRWNWLPSPSKVAVAPEGRPVIEKVALSGKSV
jgi:hypothetical protein